MSDIGLRDKLYWRARYPSALRFHCFKRVAGNRREYIALCDDDISIKHSGGQSIRRPPAFLRCAQCDCAEMKRRGWTESGPESPNWKEYL